jgi:DNA-binding HxlR family transcriptional regulator
MARVGPPAAPRTATAGERPSASPGCPVREVMHLLGKPFVLDLLHLYHDAPAPKRFVELQRQLRISPNTLTHRLKELVGAGFLTRTSYNEIPPRVDYAPTQKLARLAPLFENLTDWAAEYDLTPIPPAPTSAPTTGRVGIAAPTRR